MEPASRPLSLAPFVGLLLLSGVPAGAQHCGAGWLYLYVLDRVEPR